MDFVCSVLSIGDVELSFFIVQRRYHQGPTNVYNFCSLKGVKLIKLKLEYTEKGESG